MRIRNFDELDLAGNNNEVITVQLSSSTDSPLVNFVLNGQAWPGGSFTLSPAVTPVFKLMAQTTYRTNSGGSLQLTVTGSNGGDVSRHDEFQSPGEAFDVCMYSFVIL